MNEIILLSVPVDHPSRSAVAALEGSECDPSPFEDEYWSAVDRAMDDVRFQEWEQSR